MDNDMRVLAEATARLLLSEYRATHPQWIDEKTPIDELVQWTGLNIETFHPDDYAPGVHGFVDPDEDENLIWLCRDLSEGFRRFTLAHELGHAILHCRGGTRLSQLAQWYHTTIASSPSSNGTEDLPQPSRADPCTNNDIQEDMTSMLDQEQFQEALGIGQSYDPRSQRELAANIFAAEIMLPHDRLFACYTQEQIDPHTLENRFGVSQAALLNRLAGMLKPVPDSIVPALDRYKAPSLPIPPSDPYEDSATLVSRSQDDGALPIRQEPKQEKPTAKKRYDEFQQAAIEAPTPALIVAGPGSGKTSTLIGRTEYLIRTLEVAPHKILALTFSRKAAQEMEERLALALGTDQQGDTLPKISTFHAFCADILRQYTTYIGLRTDFALLDEAEGYFLLRRQANAMHLHHYQNLAYPTQYFPDMLKAISRAKDELITPADYAELAQHMRAHANTDEEREQAEKALELAHVYQLYEQELVRRGDSDFGGLLMLTLRLFAENPDILMQIQQRYQHILVDEFQDVNRASGVLLRELAGLERHAWVVGDANQAIYGFRGASPANIRNFTTDFPGAVVLPLSRNYRSRPDLVALAESFRCKQLEFGQEPGKNQPVRLTASENTDVTLATASDASYEIAGILQDIRSKLAEGYRYNDIVILCRTRSQVQKFARVLAEANLPVIERSGVLEQEHIKDVLSMLLLLTDASGKGILRLARQPEHRLPQHDIETIFLAARNPQKTPRRLILDGEVPREMSEEGRHAFLRISQIVHNLSTFTTNQHGADMWTLLAQYLFLESSHVRDELAQTQGQQPGTQLADYDRLLQLARHFDQQQVQEARRTGKNYTASTQIEYIEDFLEYLSLLVLLRQDGGNRQSNSEDDEPANILRVMTVHASKGLEFPVVYMPELVQQRFPLRNMGNSVVYPYGMLPPESEGKAAHESGESCLFYVGVTRARDHLILSYSERYGKRAYKRSLYLDALEAGLATERITRLTWSEQSTLPLAGIQDEEEPARVSSQPSNDFINAMRPPILSASAIEGYLRCPRQYAYSNIYHFSDEPDGYRLFWQATQKVVEEMHAHFDNAEKNTQVSTKALSSEELQARYTQHWQELGGHEEPFAPMYERHGREIVETLRRKLTLLEGETWNVRQPSTVDIAGKTIHVTIDRVEASQQEQTPARFVRTRMKGKKQKEKPETDLRELFYTLAYRQQHPGQEVELHSHNMSTGETIPLKMTAKKEQSLYENARQAIDGLERNEYPARPLQPFRCPQCPFFLICPA